MGTLKDKFFHNYLTYLCYFDGYELKLSHFIWRKYELVNIYLQNCHLSDSLIKYVSYIKGMEFVFHFTIPLVSTRYLENVLLLHLQFYYISISNMSFHTILYRRWYCMFWICFNGPEYIFIIKTVSNFKNFFVS